MMRINYIIFLVLFFLSLYSKSQSNIQTFTPSVLIDVNQVDVQFFNNIYTQNGYRGNKGELVKLNRKETYYSGFIQFLYGVDKNRRFNLGFDLNIKSVLYDTAFSSPFNVLKFQNNETARSELLTAVGPKIKFLPFKNTRLSVQSALWFPVQQNMEDNPWLDYQRLTWWTQFFYDKTYYNKYQLFLEVDLLTRIAPDFKITTLETRIPISAFFSYFPSNRTVVYGMTQFVPFISNLPTFYLQAGAGVKYQLTQSLNLELLYSNFIAGINQGAGQTYNVGLRYIK